MKYSPKSPRFLCSYRRANRRGQTLVEYGMILAILSVVAVSALMSLASGVKGVYSTITSHVASAQASH